MTIYNQQFLNRERTRVQQHFDRKKIFVEKCGQKINCFDAIQAANVDTNIYEVMNKYHCVVNEALEILKQKGGIKAFYADLTSLQTKIQDIGDVQEAALKAQRLFAELPSEIKSKYGNNLEEFLREQKKNETELKTQKNTNEVKNEIKQ